ncbi:MAG: hypothetical protein PWP24_482 [Clostridiales bacterium]|nr:hypothetical protein [Clostridiales bacterium]
MPKNSRERELYSIDESEEDIRFQMQYLSEESACVFLEIATWIEGVKGISVDNSNIHCPVLSIKAIQEEEDIIRGKIEAQRYNGTSHLFEGMTHTGMLVGSNYKKGVDTIMEWLKTI